VCVCVCSKTAQSFLDVDAITTLLKDENLPNDLELCKQLVAAANAAAKKKWEAMKEKYAPAVAFAQQVNALSSHSKSSKH